MHFRPPRVQVFGSGRRRWRVSVRILRLADFETQHRQHFPGPRTKLSNSFWCDCCMTIWLREDRMRGPEGRADFTHELDHAYIDYRGATYEQ